MDYLKTRAPFWKQEERGRRTLGRSEIVRRMKPPSAGADDELALGGVHDRAAAGQTARNAMQRANLQPLGRTRDGYHGKRMRTCGLITNRRIRRQTRSLLLKASVVNISPVTTFWRT